MTRKEGEPLTGERVLIVEDRYLIASEMADEVQRMGGKVLGPSRDLKAAQEILAREGADIALLDINLDGEEVYSLAGQLARSGVPFIFLTGYDADVLPAEWRGRPRITKPVSARALREELSKISGARKPAA
ncbi:MAG: response regulator [Phenylobacterium sp.]